MNIANIAKLSDKQLSRLKNAHNVRIKPGTTHKIRLDDSNFNVVNKKLSKGKGVNLKLTPDEIRKNAVMNGGDLFKKVGKGYQKKLETLLSEKPKSLALNVVQPESTAKIIKKVAQRKKQIGGKLKRRPNRMINFVAKKIVKPAAEEAGQPYKKTVGINPVTLGYDIGHDVIGPAIFEGKGLKPSGKSIQTPLSAYSLGDLQKEIQRRMKGKGLTLSSAPKKGYGVMSGKGTDNPLGQYGKLEGRKLQVTKKASEYPHGKYFL